MPFQRACWSWIFVRLACCLPCWLSCVGGLFVDGGVLFCPEVWVLHPLWKQAAHFGNSSFSMSGEKLYFFGLEWLVMGLLSCCYNQLGKKYIYFFCAAVIFLPSKFAFSTGFDSFEFVFIPWECDKFIRGTLLPIFCYMKPLFFFGDMPICASKNISDVSYWLKAAGHALYLTRTYVHMNQSILSLSHILWIWGVIPCTADELISRNRCNKFLLVLWTVPSAYPQAQVLVDLVPEMLWMSHSALVALDSSVGSSRFQTSFEQNLIARPDSMLLKL